MQIQDDYQVNLDAFCGPMDLLLYLIRRAEVDVHDIPIALITKQYLELLNKIENIDVEAAGEFLIMAAMLIEIKSRTLIPPDPDAVDETGDGLSATTGDAIDPRHELVKQLLSYQRYRIASEALQDRRNEFMHRFPARAFHQDFPFEESELNEIELEDVHIFDLHDAYEHIAASINFAMIGDHTVEIDDTPIALYQEDLLDRLGRSEKTQMTLQESFEGQLPKQRVGLFLAMLELTRLQKIIIRQEELLSDISIELVVDEQITSSEPPEPPEPIQE